METIGKTAMTENEPSSATLTTRQKIQMACAAALAAAVTHHHFAKPDRGETLWLLDMLLIAVGVIVGVTTILRRPPPRDR